MSAIKIILIIFGVVVVAVAGAGTAAIYGQAPKCPNQGGAARSEKASTMSRLLSARMLPIR